MTNEQPSEQPTTTRQAAFQIGVEQQGNTIAAFLLPPDGQRNPEQEIQLVSMNATLYNGGHGVPEAFEYFLKVVGRALVAGVRDEALADTVQYNKTELKDDERQEG